MQEVDAFVMNYNGGDLLLKTLEGVSRQSYPLEKIILSDDASSDQSPARAKEAWPSEKTQLEILVRNPATRNAHRHYNLCISESSKEYFVVFHNDDLYDERFLDNQVEFLKSHPEFDIAVATGTMIDENDKTLWPISIPDSLKGHPVEGSKFFALDPMDTFSTIASSGNSFLIFPSAVYRRSLFDRIGQFDSELKNAGDLDFFLRALSQGAKIAINSTPLIRYRQGRNQHSRMYDATREHLSEFHQVVRRHIDQFDADEATREKFSCLENLDRIKLGLSGLAEGKLREEHLEAQSKFSLLKRDGRPNGLEFLGPPDLIKVYGAKTLYPLRSTPIASPLAKLVVWASDPLSNPALGAAIRLKRLLR